MLGQSAFGGAALGAGESGTQPSYALLVCPIPTVSASGTDRTPRGVAHLATPALILSAAGHDSTGESGITYTVPRPTLSAYGGANAALFLPSPVLAITGTVTNWGTSQMSIPMLTVAATGTVSGTGSSNPYLSMPRPNLIGYGGAVCSVTLTGKFSVSAAGTTGSIGSAAVTLPLFEITASGAVQNHGSASLICPSPRLGATAQAWLVAPSITLSAIGSATVVAAYEAYAVNLNHKPRGPGQDAPADEVTHYTNYPFTHVVRYKESYFGVNATGMYLLEGATDAGAAIPWSFDTCTSGLGAPVLKTVASAYFAGRLGAQTAVRLHVGEKSDQTYSYATPRGANAQNHRQVFGKGNKARYYSVGASGTGELELDSIELDVHNLTRRI